MVTKEFGKMVIEHSAGNYPNTVIAQKNIVNKCKKKVKILIYPLKCIIFVEKTYIGGRGSTP